RSWAEPKKRVFAIDVLVSPHRDGTRKLIAAHHPALGEEGQLPSPIAATNVFASSIEACMRAISSDTLFSILKDVSSSDATALALRLCLRNSTLFLKASSTGSIRSLAASM